MECYIRKNGDDQNPEYELVIRSKKFIREGKFNKFGTAHIKETVGFCIEFSDGIIGRREPIFKVDYNYEDGMQVSASHNTDNIEIIDRRYESESLELCSASESNISKNLKGNISGNIHMLKKVLPRNIDLSVTDHEYKSYKEHHIDHEGKTSRTTLSVGDALAFANASTSGVASCTYYRVFEKNEGEDSYLERFFIGGKEVLKIHSDKDQEKYVEIFRRDKITGDMVQQIKIKLRADNEFCFAVIDGDGRERKITIGELRELYETLKFMADIRFSSKDCEGSRQYEDLSFFCRTFFSLYPNLLNANTLDDGKVLSDDTELSHELFPKLYKIGVFYEVEDCEDLEAIRESLFYYDDDESDFKIVRLININHTHSVLGIIPRDETKKILIFDSSYCTTSDSRSFGDFHSGCMNEEYMNFLLLNPITNEGRCVSTYEEGRKRTYSEMPPAFKGAVILNTFQIQQNGTCWAWSMAAGLAALEYETYEDIVRAASTIPTLGIDEFTAKAIQKIEGITDVTLAKKSEASMLSLVDFPGAYAMPDPYEVARKRFGVELERQAEQIDGLVEYDGVERPAVHIQAGAGAYEPRTVSARESEATAKTVEVVPQNKWVAIYHERNSQGITSSTALVK